MITAEAEISRPTQTASQKPLASEKAIQTMAKKNLTGMSTGSNSKAAKAAVGPTGELSDAPAVDGTKPSGKSAVAKKAKAAVASVIEQNAALKTTLQQIIDCPYRGLTKRIFLESKALELLTLQLHQWTEQQKPSTGSRTLQADDVERLYRARDILIRDMQNPPSLMDLARQVGINDYKLKYGFRQIFGTTVFGYLQNCRMERAKQLLAERQLSIAAIAHTVGYASQSRFCHAFKQRYGMTPIACRKTI